jgi:hypothetical protein
MNGIQKDEEAELRRRVLSSTEKMTVHGDPDVLGGYVVKSGGEFIIACSSFDAATHFVALAASWKVAVEMDHYPEGAVH